ncbi:MAG: hypothetical protein H0T51_25130 [Pirellulales bacterium]|nr:hypothetical protein [Pirellulales bacterium]
MNVLGLLGSRLKATARTAAGVSLVAISMTCGCAEETVEKSPADIEEARQQHIEIMRREAGESATPEKG